MSVNAKKKMITQDNFPGSIMEPEWSRADIIERAPYYALRLTCNARVQLAPRGNRDFVELSFDGMQYILHIKNFEKVQQLQEDYVTCYLRHKGYPVETHPDAILNTMRYNPNLLMDSLQFLISRSRKVFDIPYDKIRVYWPLQDDTACTKYRSEMPFAYMQTKEDEYYTEASRFFSHNSLSYFDAIWINRAPSGNVMAIVESVKRDGKVLIYEADDDLFNIPEWNPAHKYYTEDIKRQIRTSMAMADFCVSTNEHLANLLSKNSGGLKCFVGPNLLNMEEYIQTVAGRELDPRWTGYHLVKDDKGSPEFVHESKPKLGMNDMTPDEYNPIRILWSGSPTHELDLDQLTEPIKYIGKKYGIAIRFMFQNFMPPQFASAYASHGMPTQLIVSEEYEGFITYVPAVKTGDYQKVLKNLRPDFALCPLTDHEFNLSKSEIKPLEMAASGMPSIVSDYGPYKFIKHGHDGLKVKVNDTKGWIEALEKLIEDKEYRLQLGRNALETVKNEWSWQHDSPNRRLWDDIFSRISATVEKRKKKIRERAACTYAIIDNNVEQARYEQIRDDDKVESDR